MLRKVAAFFVLVCIFSAEVTAQKVKTVKGNSGQDIVLFSTKCKLKLKQSATTLSLGGMTFGSGPIKSTGTIGIDQKLLQSMNAQAQILDQFQFNSCQQLNSIPITDSKRSSLVALQALSSYQLAQLALLAQMYSGNADKLQDALLKWILSSGELAQQVWAKQFTGAHVTDAQLKESAAAATAYAIGQLGIANDSTKMNEALRDQLRSAIQ